MNDMGLDFLKEIDWNRHDGVNVPMINDVVRNRFYDQMLEANVANKNCIDIGFGTGLLSILALKHGAKHVTAFESDNNRYKLGQLIIDRLHLNDRITLLNQRYDNTMFDQFSDIDVLFTETMSSKLWGEGLLSNLPRKPGIKFLPENISLNIHACAVPDRFVQLLLRYRGQKDFDRFDPGVDVDVNFVNLINELGFSGHTIPDPISVEGLVPLDLRKQKRKAWMSDFNILSIENKIVASYTFSAKDVKLIKNDALGQSITDIDFAALYEDLIIDTKDWEEQNLLLVPRVLMKHDNLSMWLDAGCWGPMNPIIAIHPKSHIKFKHDLLDGKVTYNYI